MRHVCGRSESRAIGQALETDAAQTITIRTGTTVTGGLALEIDTAGAFAALGPIAIAIGQALRSARPAP